MLRKQTILGVDITNAKKSEVLEYITESVKKPSTKYFIETPNPEIIVYAAKHPHFRNLVNKAEISVPDGMGVMLAGVLAGKPFLERITGVDLMEALCKEGMNNAVRIGLLGAKPGVADKTAECLRAKYPGINIVFAAPEWPQKSIKYKVSSIKYENNEAEHILNTKYLIPDTGIDILFIAYRYPKAEEWISSHLDRLPVKVAMGVGGAFDYISGNVVRAPLILRKLGLEWLYRLFCEPWRWRRQLALVEFVVLLVKSRVIKRK